MKLAVIGTFYQRHENTLPLMRRLLIESTRKPDEIWLMCEWHEDAGAIHRAFNALYDEGIQGWPMGSHIMIRPTPKQENGTYAVIPYSNKINYALDRSNADLFVYLDNGSFPDPDKYRLMAEALEQNPEWGAAYCTQARTGYSELTLFAAEPVSSAPGRLNYTQVMHRRTDARWTLDMQYANPDIADALFWDELHKRVGDFYPVGGSQVLDRHHMESAAAHGL